MKVAEITVRFDNDQELVLTPGLLPEVCFEIGELAKKAYLALIRQEQERRGLKEKVLKP